MKKHLINLFMLMGSILFAQIPKFTWVGGPNQSGQAAYYSAKGVTNPLNIPGSRKNTAFWKDNNNNFWLFGEYGTDATNLYGNINDLWKYNSTTNLWSWHKGDSIGLVYNNWGTKYVGAPTNKPGYRERTMHWKSSNGDLYMFGGYGRYSNTVFGEFNDLWKYEIGLNQWTWIDGTKLVNQVGIYNGFSPYPGNRDEGFTWTDNNGNFWLYGGFGYYTTTSYASKLSDLWKYNVSNGWSFISGGGFVPARFGTKGLASIYNSPGGRQGGTTWTDNNGNLWLFGGNCILNTASGYLNDLWKYDITLGLWTWVSGDTTGYTHGIYGNLGVPSTTNIPGARTNSAAWVDASNNLFLFGGQGFDGSVGSINGKLNDLWKYNIATNEWTWLAGSNLIDQTGVYGVKNIYSSSNIPGARSNISVWQDATGIVWLFGGEAKTNFGAFNDLWKLDLNSVTNTKDILPTIHFEISPNPTFDKFNIHLETDNAIGEIIIYASIGEIIYSESKTQLSNKTIDLTNQPNGIYFISIKTDDGIGFEKIILTK